MKQVFSFTAWRPNNLLAKSPFSPTTLGSNPSSGGLTFLTFYAIFPLTSWSMFY
ncbi:hypothetical protein Hdeb2414_s0007g00231461 [Helianthus debilis subsp. tardiflorus]